MNLKTLDNWVSASQCSPVIFDTASVGTAGMDRWVSASWFSPVVAVVSTTTPVLIHPGMSGGIRELTGGMSA